MGGLAGGYRSFHVADPVAQSEAQPFHHHDLQRVRGGPGLFEPDTVLEIGVPCPKGLNSLQHDYLLEVKSRGFTRERTIRLSLCPTL